ncbi:hypothetical protein [Chondrinema litorale]|nr:hypothetical protein [Chondrinema litorale]UZR97525.1 hypothetical protein OQ292_27340 [Chondrinema litorale]
MTFKLDGNPVLYNNRRSAVKVEAQDIKTDGGPSKTYNNWGHTSLLDN